MGNIVPKQFLPLNNKPLLWYTIDSFLRAYADMQVVLVLPNEHIAKGRQIADMFAAGNNIIITEGGETRFHSVKRGLNFVKGNAVVFVHDGVRCLISVPLIQRCYNQAAETGSAVPAVAATDSIRVVNGTGHYVEDRQHVRIIQTPQTFLSSVILPAFEQDYKETFTDEATVVEAYGTKVFLTEGEYDNIKITRPIDLVIAERIISDRSSL
jgi:2-C-methyl-D-erythritol 4-phosphate cytidylyltransferase